MYDDEKKIIDITGFVLQCVVYRHMAKYNTLHKNRFHTQIMRYQKIWQNLSRSNVGSE